MIQWNIPNVLRKQHSKVLCCYDVVPLSVCRRVSLLAPPLTRTHLSLWLPLFDNKPAPRGLGEGEEEEEDRGRRIGGQGIQMAPLRPFYCVLEEARGWCWAE